MKIEEAIALFGYHQRSNQKTRTIQSYRPLLQKIQDRFAGRSFDSIGPDEIYHFLEAMTEGQAKSTRRLRFAQFKAFYNFLIEKADLNMRNPCDAPILAKAFKAPKQVARRILEKETVDGSRVGHDRSPPIPSCCSLVCSSLSSSSGSPS